MNPVMRTVALQKKALSRFLGVVPQVLGRRPSKSSNHAGKSLIQVLLTISS